MAAISASDSSRFEPDHFLFVAEIISIVHPPNSEQVGIVLFL